ncbi:hypothetical protein EON65_52660, partial [archaeon]
MPIARANMLLKIVFTLPDTPFLLDCVQACHAHIHACSLPIHTLQEAHTHTTQSNTEQYVDIIIDPEHFRKVEEGVTTPA